MAVRFMPDGRLKTESGSFLHKGRELSHEEAAAAATGIRVIVHDYPESEDISAQPERITSILREVVDDYLLFHYTASVYSDGAERVLVFEHHH